MEKYTSIILKIYNKITSLINRITYKNKRWFYRGFKKYDLIIYDDLFPHPVSGFRYEEFTELLTNFVVSKIIVNPISYTYLAPQKKQLNLHIQNYFIKNPKLKGKIEFKRVCFNINTRLFYTIFLNNIFSCINALEKYNIPFIFTLYPGGGFSVYNKISDFKLAKVLNSKMLQKVIVTQEFTNKYLLDNNFCSKDKIEFIFGGVVPQESINSSVEQRTSKTFNICFCGSKNTPTGKDKGYDTFIEVAKKLSVKNNNVRFHIIGGFSETDIDISIIKNYTTFYGYQKFENLKGIYKDMDIIVSPNKPFVLNSGAFDGFPLGTVVEAVLNGVVAIVTDELNQNKVFTQNRDLIIVKNDSTEIIENIEFLLKNPEKLRYISIRGKEKFKNVFSNQSQLTPRIKLLKKHISK
ncbi:glycosyltransferase family 4 protein [Lutibacter sp.]